MTGALPGIDGGARGRILIVDDNDAGRYAKSRVLRQAGYEVLEAGTGREALEHLAAGEPDLVLLDVRLPDINGLEVCRRIKQNPVTRLLPVIQMSASFCDDSSKVAGLEGGADGYITEPTEPALLIATVRAFLRMHKAERAVRELALEWQATFDAITDGVALVDTAGSILRCNRALSSLLGRPASELSGRPFDEIFAAPGEHTLWPRTAGGERYRAERSLAGRIFGITVDPVFGNQAQLRGAVAIVRDITERKHMDEQLWHTQKLEGIGVLAGGVAHDFNNLLTGILGNASLALEMLDEPRAAERALRDIVRAGERAADLTRQLLAYSGKGKVVARAIDLSSLVTGTLPLIKASFPRKVELVLHLAPDLPAVEADKTQLEQIVMNLLINAAEAIGENAGSVHVTTARRHFLKDHRQYYLGENEIRGHYVMLEVRDTGSGMDEATARRIFDPFFTTKFLGRGLGLSAALGIVRSHNGAIRVHSILGRGSTFELLFPASAAGKAIAEAPRRAVPARRPRTRTTILVVDDEQIVRSFFKTALASHGYRVLVAKNGAEALRVFSRTPDRFDMVILDLVMPVMSGKEVLPRLLEIRIGARIVVTSGQVEEAVRRDLAAWPIAGFIQKPCTVETLLRVVHALEQQRTMTAE